MLYIYCIRIVTQFDIYFLNPAMDSKKAVRVIRRISLSLAMECHHPSKLRHKRCCKTLSLNQPVLVSLFFMQFVFIGTSALNTRSQDCSIDAGYIAANCSSRDFSSVPYQIHKNIRSLDLSNNKLAVLGNKSFISFNYINHIYLRNNSMHEVQANAFLKLKYLHTLDFSNNKLTQIPTDALNVVAQTLKELVLAGNKLTRLRRNTLSKFNKLEFLDLSGNSIYFIDSGAFSNLISLNVFKIHHNAIRSLTPDSFDAFNAEKMSQVQLYDNPWECDCKVRWLWRWLNNTSPSTWNFDGYPIRCDGPVMVTGEPLDSLPLESLACEVRMKTSGSTRELSTGSNTTLICKYSSIPEAKAIWLKNSDRIEPSAGVINMIRHRQPTQRNINPTKKYELFQSEDIDTRGTLTHISELRINDFRYEDIARYRCVAKNIRGPAYTDYKLTLKGVDFNSVVAFPPVGRKAEDSNGVDIRSVVIAVAVVGGIILLVVIGVAIFCSVNRMQRKKKAKRDAIVEHVKEHFIKNSEDSPTEMAKPSVLSRGLEHHNQSGAPSSIGGTPSTGRTNRGQEDNRSTFTNDSTYKPPIDTGDESDPMLVMNSAHSPGSPLHNGNTNTYVSFGSEFTDPGEFPTPVPAYQPQQTPILVGGMPHQGGGGGDRIIAGSLEGSSTPLLDRFTPVFLDDSDEPTEDYASYPIYDSVTNSLQHPVISASPAPNSNYSNNVYSSGSDRGGGKLYGTLPAHLNGGYNRGGNYNNPHNRSLGSSSSFHYPSSHSGSSVPRTPGSVRSVAAVPPWNSSSTNAPGNSSPPIILENQSYQPPPMAHRPHPEYRDYRDMRYPPPSSHQPLSYSHPLDYPDQHQIPHLNNSNTLPSLSRDVTNVRNMAYSPVPSSASSSGPRKPPRVYIPGTNGGVPGRDCIEMTTPISQHDAEIDYITSLEAQQYSKNYGITPGTPV